MSEKLDLDVHLIKVVEQLNEELQPFIEEEQDMVESMSKKTPVIGGGQKDVEQEPSSLAENLPDSSTNNLINEEELGP